MDVYCGLDIGSTTSKAVLINAEGQILSWTITLTGYNPSETSEKIFHEVLNKAGLKGDSVKRTVATGYGRKIVKWAEKNVTEITCHAKGAFFLFPGTRTVIDVGGQDSKAIKLDSHGRVVDFAMNDKCAAGTGRFLENLSRVLGLALEEMSNCAIQAKESLEISSMCTVFAESEVISLIHQGKDRNSIVKGIFNAITARVIPLASRLKIEREVTLTGGVAHTPAFIEAMRGRLGFDLNVPENPQIVGALGAALIARG